MNKTSVCRTIIALSVLATSGAACGPEDGETAEETTEATAQSLTLGGKTCSTTDFNGEFPEGIYICKYGHS